MKLGYLCIFLLLICLRTSVSFAQTKPLTSDQVRMILDSLEVLKQAGGVVLGCSEYPSAEEIRLNTVVRMLYSLPYTESIQLLEDSNVLVRAYGFFALVKSHIDSLTSEQLEIFKDTALLPIYSEEGVKYHGVNLGQFCEMAYKAELEDKHTSDKEAYIRERVRDYILRHAKYPDSYEAIAFSGYNYWTIGNDERENTYEIRLQYKLKLRNGKCVEATHTFLMNWEYEMVLIEAERSNILKVDTPMTQEWLEQFGK